MSKCIVENGNCQHVKIRSTGAIIPPGTHYVFHSKVVSGLTPSSHKKGQQPTPKDTTEEMMSKYYNEPCYITFYTATGYAIRETLYSELNHMDRRLHRKADRMAKRLGAHHWAIFKHWTGFDVTYTPDELEGTKF